MRTAALSDFASLPHYLLCLQPKRIEKLKVVLYYLRRGVVTPPSTKSQRTVRGILEKEGTADGFPVKVCLVTSFLQGPRSPELDALPATD